MAWHQHTKSAGSSTGPRRFNTYSTTGHIGESPVSGATVYLTIGVKHLKNKAMTSFQLINGDCLEVLKTLPDNSVDSIVTDPPYELGFMGKSWDNTGIANNKEMWAECLRVLKPGGHLLAFSGTRTYHRMASAIEDAGFEVRDMIEWVYGSGFPKSQNISLMIDKKSGLQGQRGVGGFNVGGKGEQDNRTAKLHIGSTTDGSKQKAYTEYKSEESKQFSGWGTALKPAHEPICMARKPLSEKTVAENCLKWGTGGINIDESRVDNTCQNCGGSGDINIGANKCWACDGTGKIKKEWGSGHINFAQKHAERNEQAEKDSFDREVKENEGRFPANLLHDNSEEVRDTMMQDYQDPSRFFKSIIYQAKASKSERNRGCDGLEEKRGGTERMNNSDGRKEELGERDRLILTKNNHPTVKPVALMEYLVKLVSREGATVLDPFMGSGSTGIACKNLKREFIGIERDEEYMKIAEARIKAVPDTLL